MKRSNWSIPFTFMLLALLLASCGGSNDTPYAPLLSNTTGATPSFAVSVIPYPTPPVLTEAAARAPGQAASNVSFTVKVQSLNGFAGNVALSATSDQNSTGFAMSFQPSSTVKFTGSGTQISAFIVGLKSFVAPNTYSFTVSASSGGVTQTASVHPQVQVKAGAAPSFTITNATPAQTITPVDSSNPGDAKFTLNVTSVGGFAGTVNLAITTNPDGAFFNPATLTPSSVTLTAGQTKSVILDTPLDDPAIQSGTYVFVVAGTSGSNSVNALPNPMVIIPSKQVRSR